MSARPARKRKEPGRGREKVESLPDLAARLSALSGPQVARYGERFEQWAADWPARATVREVLLLSLFAEAAESPQPGLIQALVSLLGAGGTAAARLVWVQFGKGDS